MLKQLLFFYSSQVIAHLQKKYLWIQTCKWDDSSLPVCSVSCTVHLQLFTNNDILLVRPEFQLIINKYAVRSRYSSWPTQLVKDLLTSSLYTL